MLRQHVSRFRAQAFRRIGYTVGLYKLMQFHEVCMILKGKGSMGKRALAEHIMHSFGLKMKDAQGKVNVVRALGFLHEAGNRIALSPQGRALLALVEIGGPGSDIHKAFMLRQIAVSDGDVSLLLLTVLTSEDKEVEQTHAFADALDASLSEKRAAYTPLVKDISLKKDMPRILSVREATPRVGLGAKRPERTHEYACIELGDSGLSHYLRHTIGPRRRWLVDLGLLSKDGAGWRASQKGHDLVKHLKAQKKESTEFAVLEPDLVVLHATTGREHVLLRSSVDSSLFDELVAVGITGGHPVSTRVSKKEFADLLAGAYRRVRLETFEQAQVAAIRDVVMTQLLVTGRPCAFDLQLEQLAKTHPEKVQRLSSRGAAHAYISMKG